MQTPSDIAVIRARLPYIDRRSLSQAWYSALHCSLAARRDLAPALSHEGIAAFRCGAQRNGTAKGKPAVPMSGSLQRRNAVATAARSAVDRQHMQASAVPKQPPPRNMGGHGARMPHGASFTVTLGDARVRIVARGDGRRMHLTAVCSSRHAELVSRALAHASSGLRWYGASVDTAIHCEDE